MKRYNKPIIETIKFTVEDVITTSFISADIDGGSAGFKTTWENTIADGSSAEFRYSWTD